MKKTVLSMAGVALALMSAHAQGPYLNEILFNPVGTDGPHEYFELRGAPALSLSGYYLIGVEGDVASNPGDIQDIFDLGSFSLGLNGFLVGFQKGNSYSGVALGANSFVNAGTGAGWGNGAGSSTIGHTADGTATDAENPSATYMLINIGGGAVPTLTQDLDATDDSFLDALPAGWSIFDSVGITDAATDISYGAINFRFTGLGVANSGTVVDLAYSGGSQYFGRQGDSTGSAAADWVESTVNGTGPDFTFSMTDLSEPAYSGLPLSVMQLGGPNAVPEPATFVLLGFGLLGLVVLRRRF